MRWGILLGLWLALLPSIAHAEWRQASSAHFVVYANDTERDIRRFSEHLERYHAAIAYITDAQLEVPSSSNRVTVYVVRNTREVRKLAGDGARYLGGFYIPRAGGSLAIVPQITGGGSEPNFSMIVLLHEYAHHFMISASSFPMPRWLAEGGAEFLASASFEADGTVNIGMPAQHRALELLVPQFARDVEVADLIDSAAYDKRKNKGYDAFYGKSWLLYHYLTFERERQGQLKRYMQLMAQGKSSGEAGLETFGDLAKLEDDLERYLARRKMLSLKLRPDLLTTGPVTVRQLSAGEAAMMPVRIRSRRGVNDEQAKELLVDARAVAARYPEDPAVLAALAEAEHDAGNDVETVTAADAALAKDPSQVNAYIQKGLSLMRMAADAKPGEGVAAFQKARKVFLDLNRLENDHPLPLIYNYRIMLEQGREPTLLALRGLQRAVELAPFDLGLRMELAMQQLRMGQRDQARRNLTPIAYNPHGGGLAQAAQDVIVRMDKDPKWDGSGMSAPRTIDTQDAAAEPAAQS